MKRINKRLGIVLLSACTLLLSTLLAACSFKDVKVNFLQEQCVFDAGQSVDLAALLNVEHADKQSFGFAVSNSALFSVSNGHVSGNAGQSGRGFVYATYEGNNLAQMELVLRRPFDAPENVRWDERGYVTWDSVSGIFDGETEVTAATQFLVQGERVIRSDNGLGEVVETHPINQTVSGQTFTLSENGEYHLRISAVQNGYFSNGIASDEATFFAGYMPQLTKDNLSFSDGVLSWNADVLQTERKFQVKFDGFLVGEPQSQTSFDLTPILDSDSTSSGVHTASVVVFDDSESEDKKFAKESESVNITKLQVPQVNYVFDLTNGGLIEILSQDNAEMFDVQLISETDDVEPTLYTATLLNNRQQSVKTAFDESELDQPLPAGVYSLQVIERCQDTNDMFFFRSKPNVVENKIVKLSKATLFGDEMQHNQADSLTFHALARADVAPIASRLLISNLNRTVGGFEVDNLEKTFDITLPDGTDSGIFEFALTQFPRQRQNLVAGHEVFAVNSDRGPTTQFAKLPTISGGVTHEYIGENGEEKSVLTFKKIDVSSVLPYEGTISYKLKRQTADGRFEDVDEGLFVQEETGDGQGIKFVFNDSIERMFEPVNGGYAFCIEADSDKPHITIGSLTEKSLQTLSSPILVTDTDNIRVGTPLVWRSAEGERPAEYRVETFKINKTTFEEYRGKVNEYDPLGIVAREQANLLQERDKNYGLGIEILEEGYYYLKIFAVTGDANHQLSSHDFLPVLLAVSEQLHIESVKFGFDENVKSLGEGFSGYYVKVTTSDENVNGFDIYVDDQKLTYSKSAENIYGLQEDFAEEKLYHIRVEAHWKDAEGENDDLIYLPAEETFDVTRLKKVSFADLEFDERTFEFSVQNGVGTKQVEVQDIENGLIEPEYEDDFTRVMLGDKTGITLRLQRVSVSAREDKEFSFIDVEQTRMIYLSSEPVQLKFERLSTPTSLAYEGGVLSYMHEKDIARPNVTYVLDCVFKGSPIGDQSVRAYINYEGNPNRIVVEYGGTSVDFVVDAADGNLFYPVGGGVQFKLDKLLRTLAEKSTMLASIYKNVTTVDVSLWAKFLNDKTDEGIVELSSANAKTQDSSEVLSIKKMQKLTIKFHLAEDGKHTLSWDAVDADAATVAQTKYIVYQATESGIVTLSPEPFPGLAFSLENAAFETETDKRFTYYVVATNPKFLDASSSNKICILKNSKLTKVRLDENGTLSFALPNASFFKRIDIKKDGVNLPGGESGKLTISGEGIYSFQYIGADTVQDNANDATLYYLNSDITSWQVTQLTSIAKEEKPKVNFDGNIISWQNPFTEGLNGVMEYVLFFKDSQNQLLTYTTTAEETSQAYVNFQTNTALREIISKLAADKVQVQVAAHVFAKEFALGETVFYEPSQTLPLSGKEEFNYYLFADVCEISKLTAPEVTNVEFVGFNAERTTQQDWENAQSPTIKVTIRGNYGENASFCVYINQDPTPLEGVDFVKSGEGEYYFQLTPTQYSFAAQDGQNMKLTIFAIEGGTGSGVGSLPSSGTAISFQRASQISKVEFLPSDFGHGYSRLLRLTIPQNTQEQFVGNVVLKITYAPNGAEQSVQFVSVKPLVSDGVITFSDETILWLQNLVDNQLENGGKIVVSAYADNFVDMEHHIFVIACSKEQASDEYVVLQSVKQENIVRTKEGLKIENVNFNDDDTIYVLQFKTTTGMTETVNITKTGDAFEFVIPSNWDASEGTIVLYAVHDGKYIVSKKAELTYALQRLDSVGEVSLKRDPDLSLRFEWTSVENASGYLVQAFIRDADGQKLAFVAEIDVDKASGKVSCELSELLGENYSKISEMFANASSAVFGWDFSSPVPLVVEITALGDATHNNAIPTSIHPTIQPHEISPSDVFVKDGLAYFRPQTGKTYKYRFVRPNSSLQLTAWADVPTSGILDVFSSEFDNMLDPRFDVDIFVLADENVSTNSHFDIDSVIFTTKEDDSFTFEKLKEIVSVSYANDSEKVLVTFATNGQDVHSVFAGVSEDAITSGQAVRVDLEDGAETDQCTVFLVDILNKLDAAGVKYSSNSKIYFWAYKESEGATQYVVSQVFDQFEFSIETEFAVKQVARLQDIKGEQEEFAQGYINTFLLFDNIDTSERVTLGINVKITHSSGRVYNHFVTTFDTTLQAGTYAINLNNIFDMNILDSDPDNPLPLWALYGDFDVAVMKVGTINGVYSVSRWVTTWEEKDLHFQRLQPALAIQLREGNLSWQAAEDKVDEFFVYFFDVDEEGQPASYRIIRPGKNEVDGKVVPKNFLNASDYALESHSYYLAVQSVDFDDVFVLASKISYKTDSLDDGSEKLTVVYKNQLNAKQSPLTLRANGELIINFAENDDDENNFVTALKMKSQNPDVSYETVANLLATKVFASPFTFTLQDLLNGQVNIRLRFKPVGDTLGTYATFNIDSFMILEDIAKYYDSLELRLPLSELFGNLTSDAFGEEIHNLMTDFFAKVSSKNSGIGNSKVFMDDYLEALQAGRYTMEYCVLGNAHTLNSEWYSFVNTQTGTNLFGVNAAPSVQIVKTAESDSEDNLLNNFKVMIKKSRIETATADTVAESYYVRIGTRSFKISKIDATYKLSLVGDEARSITVKDEGEYLSFFLNLNGGDSLLGVFGEDLPNNNAEQIFEICAVGNETSLSSKSDKLRVIFLTFNNFAINDGVFQWTSPNRFVKTKIVLQQQDSTILHTEVVDTSSFAIPENLGAGQYPYAKFLLTCEEKDLEPDMCFVDSNIYVVNNIYKLYAPILSNNIGHIGITADQHNIEVLKNIYSDGGSTFMYEIKNNASSLGYKFPDTRAEDEHQKELLYAPGVTGLSAGSEAFAYKNTEQRATEFVVQALGTTATLAPQPTDQYNVKKLLCQSINGVIDPGSGICVAASSAGATLPARMLDAVQYLEIDQQSMLSWQAVTGREGEVLPQQAVIVYRLDIQRYSHALDGSVKNDYAKTIYTTNTYFDFSTLTDSSSDDVESLEYSVCVRALALQRGYSAITLDDGGVAGGNVRFESGKYALMGEGAVMDGIRQLPTVVADSVKVEDRVLTWLYRTTDTSLTEENFKDFIDFIVTEKIDGKVKQILGQFSVSIENESGGRTFKIMFTENASELAGGLHTLTVYATAAAGNSGNLVRSLGRSGEVTKVAQIEEQDFEVLTGTATVKGAQGLETTTSCEILSFEKYFADVANKDNLITATFMLGGEAQEVQFSVNADKIYIFSDDVELSNVVFGSGDRFVRTAILVIKENVAAEVSFVVSGLTDVLSSDVSQSFNLTRAEWAEGAFISWNQTRGEFSWTAASEDVREYVIQATYTYKISLTAQGTRTTTRIYHSTSTIFQPTIIGQVELSVRIKYGDSSLQSEELSHLVGEGVQTDAGREYVNFDIFACGQGTQENPYIISGENQSVSAKQQFQNIALRQTKRPQYLCKFEQIGSSQTVIEAEKYYFRLAEDVNVEIFEGVLFAGSFEGEIDGDNHEVSYVVTRTISLEQKVTILASDNVAEITTGQRKIDFVRGASLFENVASSAKISNLKISVKYGNTDSLVNVGGFAIMAGLAVTNNGQISGVELVGFSNHFVAQNANDVMVYAGLVGRNIGTDAIMENCSVTTDISISDSGQMQFIFASGIVYTNDATVRNCTSGSERTYELGSLRTNKLEIICTNDASFVQIGGIAITNTNSGGEKMTACTNNFDIYVEGGENCYVKCYMAGVVVLGKNMGDTGSQNVNHGTLEQMNIASQNWVHGDIIATTRAT